MVMPHHHRCQQALTTTRRRVLTTISSLSAISLIARVVSIIALRRPRLIIEPLRLPRLIQSTCQERKKILQLIFSVMILFFSFVLFT